MQKKRSSKTLYEGTIFTVTKDEVEIKGCVYERDIIHHHGGVGVLAIKEDKILFVKQYRYAIGKHTLEVPAGKLEKGEDPYTCGLRELSTSSPRSVRAARRRCWWRWRNATFWAASLWVTAACCGA